MTYEEALQSIPAPGSGCHPALLGVANLGVLAGLDDDAIARDLRANIPAGTRKVSDKEIREAVAKARATAAPARPAGTAPQGYGWNDPIPAAATVSRLAGVQLDGETGELPAVPPDWDPVEDLRRYLCAVFRPDERPCVCVEAFQEGGKWKPRGKGRADRTREELVWTLRQHAGAKEPFTFAFGDYERQAGAWVRVNPVGDSLGKDSSVACYRNCLVESDTLPPARQLEIIRRLRMPCAAIVHSGGKSVHAIVRIDARDIREYYERFEFLTKTCSAAGLQLDHANRNPSRYSRVAGVWRGDRAQWLIDADCGCRSWQEWVDYLAEEDDDLPPFQDAADLLDNPPPLAECVIDGVLRRRHKLLLTAPSKFGKSFLFMQLALAIATGGSFLGWKCRKGRVLYVNLEVDDPSAAARLGSFGVRPPRGSVEIWNLRGRATPMNLLAPKIVRRCREGSYLAIIIDPIYKVITGDENAAAEMASFCNWFDRIAAETGACVIYSHHHSKGEQGQKNAWDRASGSGVFARDPDALLDLIQLPLDDDRRATLANRWACDALAAELDRAEPTWRQLVPQDDALVSAKLAAWAASVLGDRAAEIAAHAADEAAGAKAWRLEGILREFPGFPPRRGYYRWPRFVLDEDGLLDDVLAPGEQPPRRQRKPAAKKVNWHEDLNFEVQSRDVKISEYANRHNLKPSTVIVWARKALGEKVSIDGDTIHWNQPKPPNPDDY